MKTYKVTYKGASRKFRKLRGLVRAENERQAVEDVYAKVLQENYFPQDDGSIKDCDGVTIATTHSDTIEYDGGYFSAEEQYPRFTAAD